jgi:hypothetical protein
MWNRDGLNNKMFVRELWRLKHKLKDNIKMDLTGRGYEGMDFIQFLKVGLKRTILNVGSIKAQNFLINLLLLLFLQGVTAQRPMHCDHY